MYTHMNIHICIYLYIVMYIYIHIDIYIYIFTSKNTEMEKGWSELNFYLRKQKLKTNDEPS